MYIRQYEQKDTELWDQFCLGANNSTFLHTRRFLNYHGNRFQDRSLIVENEKSQICAIFPAAVSPQCSTTITSHPGLTYGGLVTGTSVYGEIVFELFEKIINYYKVQGYQSIQYKAIPYIYQKVPSADDLYAMFRLKASRYRCDLSMAIDLKNRVKPSQRRRRSLTKALKNNIDVQRDTENFEPLWLILSKALKDKYSASPTHSLEEIKLLVEQFPENIEILTGVADKQVIAGLVLFNTELVMHAQYITASSEGYHLNALDLLFDTAIQHAEKRGHRYFDFGISNENNGLELNQSLYQFKHEFGGGGVVHEFYEISW